MKSLCVTIILISAFLIPLTELPAGNAKIADPFIQFIITTPTNRTYYQENLPLKVTLNYTSKIPVDVNITYRLDDQTVYLIDTIQSKHFDNRIISGIATLLNLGLGQHKITVYTQRMAEDKQSVTCSEKTVYFSIGESADTDWSFIRTNFYLPSADQNYNSKHSALNFSLEWLCANLYKVSYRLDGQDWHYLPVNLDLSDFRTSWAGIYPETDTLPLLGEGNHNLTVCIEGQWGYSSEHRTKQNTINFTVDTISPQISNVSIQQSRTYNQSNLPLTCDINEVTSWVGYSIDNAVNVTLSEKATITQSPGSHSIVIYANDTAGNMGKSETVTFTIAPDLSVFLSVIMVVVMIVAAAIIAYYRSRKR